MKTLAALLSTVLIAALLTGCGVTSTVAQPGANGTATPSSSSTGTMNTSAPTTTTGPVQIATDHTRYAPTDAIAVTVTNGTATSIYAFDHQASCTILTLELAATGGWQEVTNLARCTQGKPTRPVELAANHPYQATIFAGILRQGDAGFAPGTYRLKLTYFTTPPTDAGQAGGASQVRYSMEITVATDVPPQPLPTGAPSTTSTGTVTSNGTTTPFSH